MTYPLPKGPKQDLGSQAVPHERRQEYLDNVVAKLAVAERPPPLPLGYDPNDPRGKAKDCALRLLNFTRTLAQMYSLHPEEVVYAVELFAANEYNADDMKLSPEEFRREIVAAKEYYRSVQASRTGTPPVRPPTPPRTIADPRAPWNAAIKNAERLVKFTVRLVQEMELTPAMLVYAIELFRTNLFNVPDFPLAPTAVKRTRDIAFHYYERNRP